MYSKTVRCFFMMLAVNLFWPLAADYEEMFIHKVKLIVMFLFDVFKGVADTYMGIIVVLTHKFSKLIIP